MEENITISKRITVYGIVQSVGFRPFIYRLAKEYSLSGYVRNISSGVEIEVFGDRTKIENFVKDIQLKLPSKAKIYKLLIENVDKKYEVQDFKILESENLNTTNIIVPAEIKVCN